MADLLPSKIVEVKREINKIEKKDSIIRLNEFMLYNLQIPLNEIKLGGPPKDGIPAIDNPIFVDGNDAHFLNGNDLVLGVTLNDISKAYPIKVLNYHEIVNDQFGEIPVLVTYCPLCMSGMAFLSKMDDQPISFGVSGLLYNSDVLLYDRLSNSLWSQIMMKGIAGNFAGKELEYITTQYSVWKMWKKEHPNTLVLSPNTGFSRDYSKSPYLILSQVFRANVPCK